MLQKIICGKQKLDKMTKNYCIKFVKRPGANREAEEDNFTYSECPYPELCKDEIIIRTLYLSVDPLQRMQMNDVSPPFLTCFELDDVVPGLYGVGVVVESQSLDFNIGHIVINKKMDWWPWQLYFKTANVGKNMVKTSSPDPKCEITYYGMPGLTVMSGFTNSGILENNGDVGETFVVTGAAGSCGHLAGQIALANGYSVVIGICGSHEKCKTLTEQLQFTNAINYKTENVKAKLEEFCPNGIDVYFDNVGGELSETVILQMKENGRVIVCGQIAGYNDSTKSYPHTLTTAASQHLEKMKIYREAVDVYMDSEKFAEFREELDRYRRDDSITILDSVVDGLEKSPNAFCGMMTGSNIGKQVVKVSDL